MIIRIVTAIVFVALLVGIVGYARGYRLDVSNTVITSTGLVAVTSTPRSAKVYVNSELKGITDLSLNLSPGTYTFTVVKEGYFPWQKTIKLKGEIVQSLDAILYPVNSSLNPLTNIGIVKAIPIGTESDRIILFSDNTPKTQPEPTPLPEPTSTADSSTAGIYVYDASRRVISFLPNLQRIISYDKIGPEIDPLGLEIVLSPDGKQMIVFTVENKTEKKTNSYRQYNEYYPQYTPPANFTQALLVNIDDTESTPLNITETVDSLMDAWTQTKDRQLNTLTNAMQVPLGEFFKKTTHIIDISQDKTRILYQATASARLAPALKQPMIGSNQTVEVRETEKNTIYLYDIKEDKNYPIVMSSEAQKQSLPILHPNSKNIIYNESKSISISDFDGKNKYKVYSGPFDPRFFAISSDGRVFILTNLNPELTQFGDLYAIGIR
ncbi:MAG: PEGA domain-containing protein [Candidatus Roizmanbacteria bacterium]